jgi:hypothetical protein
VEFQADLVVELRAASGEPALAIVVEVQRDVDARKKYSWPVYAVVLRAKKQCPTIVLVVAADAPVAAWAAEKIDLGLGLGSLQPLVVGPSNVPEIMAPAHAAREIELAILSAVAHGNGPNGLAVVLSTLDALTRLDRAHATVFAKIIYDSLRGPMQAALEALVMERHSQGEIKYPPFMERVFEQGELKGKREGELKGRRDALLRLAARAQIALSDAERARIEEWTDVAVLDRWIDNSLGAKTAADLLA